MEQKREKRDVNPSSEDGARALAEALQSLKGDHTPAPTDEFREFKNLRDKFEKAFGPDW